jgi:hypothetical protein
VADVLDRRELKRKELVEQIADAQKAAASPLGDAWKDCRSLIDALDKAPDQADARTRLRAAIRRTIESVWCLFVARGVDRIAAVQMFFAGGTHRDFLIQHRAAHANAASRRCATWSVKSFADDMAAGDFDLRNQQHARAVERLLEMRKLDLRY